MSVKLNLSGLIKICEELNNKISTNFISNISLINKNDILLSFSFYNKEKLLISLNHSNPFISMVDASINYKTTIGQLNDNLRHYVKGAYIDNIEVYNNDRVLRFSLYKTNEFYQKDRYYLIVELIPTLCNIILVDENNKIVFSKHYTDLTAARPILRGYEYIELSKKEELKITDFDMDKYHKDVQEYLYNLESINKKDSSLPLYNHLTSKVKSLSKKIKVLNNEIIEAKKKLEYKSIGETLLTLQSDKENLEAYKATIKNTYNDDLSIIDNINNYFSKYKKAKRTIEHDLEEIDLANKQIEELSHIIEIFQYYSSDEITELYKKYLPKELKIKIKDNVKADSPHYIVYKGVKIGFGKNKEQNNNLTFKLANKDYYYLHVKDYPSSHVIIFSNNPDKEVIDLACQIALILSNKESGEIYLSDVKDVKKGDSLGKVNLLKYQSIYISKIDESNKLLLKEQKRF